MSQSVSLFELIFFHLTKVLSIIFQATVNRSKGNRTEISKAELIQKSSYCRVSGTILFIMIVLAVVVGNLMMEMLDALQTVIWIFWNCRPMAMFGVDQILGDVEFNEHFYLF